MKKAILLILSLILIMSCVSCTEEEQKPETTPEQGEPTVVEFPGNPEFIVPVKTSGHNLYVDPESLATPRMGTFEKPFSSLKDAISLSKPGDTIYLRGGTYNEKIYIGKGGTSEAWITVMPYKNEEVVFDNFGGTSDSCLIFEQGAKYWYLKGFEIRNYTGAGLWIKDGAEYIYADGLNIHDISNPAFTNYGSSGVLGSGSYVLLNNCYIHDIGQDRKATLDHCIYLGSPEFWVIQNSHLKTAPGGGIHQYCSDAPEAVGYGVYVRNNIIEDCFFGMVLSSCKNYYVSNNTFLNSNSTDIFVLNIAYDCIFQNNIFYCNREKGAEFETGSWDKNDVHSTKVASKFLTVSGKGYRNNTYENNLIFADNFRKKNVLPSSTCDFANLPERDKNNTYSNNIVESPCLDIKDGVFTLSDASPCKNSSVINDYTPKYDRSGNEVTNPNIGAF